MTKIIIVGCLIGLTGLIITWLVISLIRKKLKKEEVNFTNHILKLVTTLIVFGGLVILEVILSFKYVRDNQDKILEGGQKIIANTVEYGATAVFEGLGKTIDHFSSKWEEKYISLLNNIEVLSSKITETRKDSLYSYITIQIIFNNKNKKEDRINLDHICYSNYVLVGDKDEIYYPLTINSNQYDNFLPFGKTELNFTGTIPLAKELTYFRMLDNKYDLALKR